MRRSCATPTTIGFKDTARTGAWSPGAAVPLHIALRPPPSWITYCLRERLGLEGVRATTHTNKRPQIGEAKRLHLARLPTYASAAGRASKMKSRLSKTFLWRAFRAARSCCTFCHPSAIRQFTKGTSQPFRMAFYAAAPYLPLAACRVIPPATKFGTGWCAAEIAQDMLVSCR